MQNYPISELKINAFYLNDVTQVIHRSFMLDGWLRPLTRSGLFFSNFSNM